MFGYYMTSLFPLYNTYYNTGTWLKCLKITVLNNKVNKVIKSLLLCLLNFSISSLHFLHNEILKIIKITIFVSSIVLRMHFVLTEIDSFCTFKLKYVLYFMRTRLNSFVNRHLPTPNFVCSKQYWYIVQIYSRTPVAYWTFYFSV